MRTRHSVKAVPGSERSTQRYTQTGLCQRVHAGATYTPVRLRIRLVLCCRDTAHGVTAVLYSSSPPLELESWVLQSNVTVVGLHTEYLLYKLYVTSRRIHQQYRLAYLASEKPRAHFPPQVLYAADRCSMLEPSCCSNDITRRTTRMHYCMFSTTADNYTVQPT